MPATAFAVSRSSLVDRLELTKPRITVMVVFTSLVGFVMASPGPLALPLLGLALVGTALVASGAAVLNQVIERGTDALMLRTRQRPLAAGRVQPAEAIAFGGLVTLAGLALLRWGCG